MKEFLSQQVNQIKDPLLKTNLTREYLQARTLQILQEQGAFLNWAFLGGTALRFLYSIPRYSEDLDFSLIDPAQPCLFEEILKKVKTRFESENYEVSIKVFREKTVRSAFIKFAGLLYEMGISPHKSEVLSIKLEVDTNPPPGAAMQTTLCRRFVTVNVTHHDKASLLAGKLHACLTRQNAKGRDWYDLLWYLADRTWPAPNFRLLNAALTQTGRIGPELSARTLPSVLSERLGGLDWKEIRADVTPFLERPEELNLLTKENVLKLVLNAPAGN
jgi:predicted nucleotidyltransferase component of viral defense system